MVAALFSRFGRLAALPAGVAALSAAHRCSCDASESQQPGYKMPPADIAALADYRPVAGVSLQPEKKLKLLYMHHDPMLTIEDVSAPVLKLGGARFNPCTLVPHGTHGPDLYHSHGLYVARLL